MQAHNLLEKTESVSDATELVEAVRENILIAGKHFQSAQLSESITLSLEEVINKEKINKEKLIHFLNSLNEIDTSEWKNNPDQMNALSAIFFEQGYIGVCHTLITEGTTTAKKMAAALAKAGFIDCLQALLLKFSEIKPENVILPAIQGKLESEVIRLIPNCADPIHVATMAVGKALSTGQGDFAKSLIQTFGLPIDTLIGLAVEGGLSQYCEEVWEYKVNHPEGSNPAIALHSLAMLIAEPLSKKTQTERDAWLTSIKIPLYKTVLTQQLDFCTNLAEKKALPELDGDYLLVPDEKKLDGDYLLTDDAQEVKLNGDYLLVLEEKEDFGIDGHEQESRVQFELSSVPHVASSATLHTSTASFFRRDENQQIGEQMERTIENAAIVKKCFP